MQLRPWHLVIVVAAGAIYLLLRPPSAAKIVRGTEVSVAAETIEYSGVRYRATWSDPITRSGEVRHLSRAYTRSVPVVVFDMVLTTGEFSDPAIVTIESTGGGNFYWRANREPQGTLIVLHIIPETEAVLERLARIDRGDRVEITGRDEVRGAIEGADGSFLRLGHANHRFVLATGVVIEE